MTGLVGVLTKCGFKAAKPKGSFFLYVKAPKAAALGNGKSLEFKNAEDVSQWLIAEKLIGFLARWARRLSWRETARAFGTSWECVYRSVDWFVQWGLAHRKLEGVESIGVDEIHWGQSKGANSFLTVIYQIDRHCRRLL